MAPSIRFQDLIYMLSFTLVWTGCQSYTQLDEHELLINDELIVLFKNQIDLIKVQTGQIIRSVPIKISGSHEDLIAIGYSDGQFRVVKKNGQNYTLLSLSRPLQNATFTSAPGRFSRISLAAFDPDALYVFDDGQKAIYRLPSNQTFDNAVHAAILTNETTVTGMDSDICNRRLYWTTGSSLKVLSLNGPMQGVLRADLVRGRSLSVDQYSGQLFWLDNNANRTHTDTFIVMTSQLDGSHVRVVCQSDQTVEYGIRKMVVGRHSLYLLDWHNHAVWKVVKRVSDDPISRCPMQIVRRFYPSKPVDLAIRDSSFSVDKTACHQVQLSVVLDVPTPAPGRHAASFAAADDADACHNYCFHDGSQAPCHVSPLGSPICVCSLGFAGSRCQIDLCQNYCMNQGNCSVSVVSSDPECQCLPGFAGTRCHLHSVEVDSPYVLALAVSLVVTALLAITLLATVVVLVRKRAKKHPPKTVRSSLQKRSRNVPSAPKLAATGLCNNGLILDLEDCCQMTLCSVPCPQAIFRKPPPPQTDGDQASREADDRQVLLGATVPQT